MNAIMPPGLHHPRAFGDQARLVRHMRKRLLADHDVEAGVGERHLERVAEPEVDQVLEADQPGQPERALVAARA